VAIGYDNANSVSGTTVSAVTIPAFAVAGENRFIFVGAGGQAATTRTMTSVVRNGTETFTQKWMVETVSNKISCYGGYYAAPGAGNYSIVVTLNGAVDIMMAGAVSLTGVDQVTPTGVHGTALNEASGVATVTVAANDDEWLIDMVHGWGSTCTAGADQTSRWTRLNVGAFSSGGSSTQPGTADDVMSWATFSGTEEAIGAVPIVPYIETDTYGTPRDHSGVKPWSNIWRPARA
jgi:hypothetical protein